jgi:hypothetical protein
MWNPKICYRFHKSPPLILILNAEFCDTWKAIIELIFSPWLHLYITAFTVAISSMSGLSATNVVYSARWCERVFCHQEQMSPEWRRINTESVSARSMHIHRTYWGG